jgi:hypothetical protein
MIGLDADPHALQAMRQIGGRVKWIVRQNQKLVILAMQSLDERIGSWDQFTAAHNHAIHIDEITFGHVSSCPVESSLRLYLIA